MLSSAKGRIINALHVGSFLWFVLQDKHPWLEEFTLFFIQQKTQSSYTFSIPYRWFATRQLSISTEYKNYFEQ